MWKQPCFSSLFARGGCPAALLILGARGCTWAESPSWAPSQLGERAGPAGAGLGSQPWALSFVVQRWLRLGDAGQAGRAGGRHLWEGEGETGHI